jgi:hypothetical protein
MQFGQHRRRPLAKLFFADASFTQPLPVDQPPFAAFGRCSEVCQVAILLQRPDDARRGGH